MSLLSTSCIDKGPGHIALAMRGLLVDALVAAHVTHFCPSALDILRKILENRPQATDSDEKRLGRFVGWFVQALPPSKWVTMLFKDLMKARSASRLLGRGRKPSTRFQSFSWPSSSRVRTAA